MSDRIDSHQHFWKPARGDYGWLTPELKALYRDFLPQHLFADLDACSVSRTILVQAAPTVAETRFLLEIARETEYVAGVVGWVDFEDARETLDQLADHRELVGVRPMIQDLPDDRWILRPSLDDAFIALERSTLCLDALVTTRHLPHLIERLSHHPDLPVVIDHGAKPDIAQGPNWTGFDDWRRNMRRLARETRSACKLSGLVTEASTDWTVAHLRPFVDVLLELFGPQRLMWGSDWPVVTLAASYQSWHDATEELLGELTDTERDAIFGGAARHFYGLAHVRRR